MSIKFVKADTFCISKAMKMFKIRLHLDLQQKIQCKMTQNFYKFQLAYLFRNFREEIKVNNFSSKMVKGESIDSFL